MNLDIIDPSLPPAWDDLLLSTPGHSFFHSSAWAKVLKESYGYTPLYFATIKNGQFSALVPVMEVRSFLTGKRGVSLPFTDYCEPIIQDKGIFVNLANSLIEYGKSRGWKYIELRGGDRYLNPQSAFPMPQSEGPTPCSYITYLGHTLDLTKGEKALYSGLRGSTRRNIKKALKKGVGVRTLNSLEFVKEFYRLNCMTRRKHGLPPQPYRFFQKVCDHIISKGLGFITLASHSGQNIAGAVYFHFGCDAVFKYGASDNKFQHLRPNNLVMWEAIKWYCQNGYKNLSLGRTDPDNQGLLQFKSGWGGKQENINYYKYEKSKEAFINIPSPSNYFENRILKYMPVALLKIVGSTFYRHLG